MAEDYLNIDVNIETDVTFWATDGSIETTSKPVAGGKMMKKTKRKELSKTQRWNANSNLTVNSLKK
jgi:hypothetical protein